MSAGLSRSSATPIFEAASRLRGAEPPIYHLLLAGDGPLFGRFDARVAERDHVIMLSNIKDVASFLRSLDIFILCSEHEGTPQALLEAMACALPIIATRVGGIPHVLDADGLAPAGRLLPLRPDRLARESVGSPADRPTAKSSGTTGRATDRGILVRS